jgi:hypothetical protein
VRACFRCLVSRLIGGSFLKVPVEYSTAGAPHSKFNGLQYNSAKAERVLISFVYAEVSP